MMKNTYTFDEWEKMDVDKIDQIFGDIDDDQAINSDFGGDSDAEDDKIVPSNAIPTTRSKGTCLTQPSTSNIIGEENEEALLQFDSDDSIGDPNFIPDQPKKRTQVNDSSSGSSDDEIQNSDNFEFSKIKQPPQTFSNFRFTRPFGPKIELDISSPIKIFSIFLEPMFLAIVEQSNLYAQQNGVGLELSVKEFKAFLGIVIIMGFHVLPAIRLYWSTNINFFVPRIANVMTLKRFLQILRYLHLNDNSKMPKKGEEKFDKLYKVRPLLHFLNSVYKNTFYPSRNLSIDESMIGFKGRSSLKQYMPLKPIKRGFKVWAITCAATGFLLGFEVYQGKTNKEDGQTLGESVVLGLSLSFQTLGYCLFFDRFFTTIPLLRKLLSVGLFGCGTLQSNRKFYPKNKLVDDKRMKFGNHDSASDGDISVTKWKDRGKKSVIVASNMHNPEEVTYVKRRNKVGERENIECPNSISEYNKHMGGVDQFDQMMSSYSISWKSRRWWLKIFYYLIDSAVVNSYVLYKTTLNLSQNKTKPMSHLSFRSILADELIGNYCNRKQPGRKSSCVVTKAKKKSGRVVKKSLNISDSFEHLPIRGTCRRCAYCSSKKNVKRSRIECKECKVSLCLECFLPFHKQ